MYATNDEVRADAGFTGNTDIDNALINTYQTLANATIDSYIGAVYTLTDLTGTLFAGSKAETTLKKLEIMLAKAYLFQKIYGYDDSQDKNGYFIEEKLMEQLKSVKEGSIRLFDVNSTEFTRREAQTGGLMRAGGYTVDEYEYNIGDEY